MVKLILVLDQSLDGKLFLHERLARLAKRLPQGFVRGQAHETVLQLGQVLLAGLQLALELCCGFAAKGTS